MACHRRMSHHLHTVPDQGDLAVEEGGATIKSKTLAAILSVCFVSRRPSV